MQKMGRKMERGRQETEDAREGAGDELLSGRKIEQDGDCTGRSRVRETLTTKMQVVCEVGIAVEPTRWWRRCVAEREGAR